MCTFFYLKKKHKSKYPTRFAKYAHLKMKKYNKTVNKRKVSVKLLVGNKFLVNKLCFLQQSSLKRD